MIAMALIYLFGGDCPLGYVKNSLLIVFLSQLHYQGHVSTKLDYNLDGFSQCISNIWL